MWWDDCFTPRISWYRVQHEEELLGKRSGICGIWLIQASSTALILGLALAVSEGKSCLSYPVLRFTSPSWTSSKVTWIQRRCIRVFRGLGISTSPTPPPWLLWLPQDPRAETGEVHPLGTCQHPSSSLQAKPIPAAGAQGLEVFLGWISDAENTMCLKSLSLLWLYTHTTIWTCFIYIFQVSNICGFATRKP